MTCPAVIESLKVDALSRNLKKHFHDEYSITIILNGKCGAWIEGNEYLMKAGDVLIVSPGIVHSCVPLQDNAALSYTASSLTENRLENYFMDSSLYRKFTSRTFMLIPGIADKKEFHLSDTITLSVRPKTYSFLKQIIADASITKAR